MITTRVFRWGCGFALLLFVAAGSTHRITQAAEEPSSIEVTGTVVADCGGPVPDARLNLMDGAGTVHSTTSGADGRYAFTAIPYGGTGRIAVIPPPHFRTLVGWQPLDFTADQIADFTLGCLYRVTGVVSAAGSGPLAGVLVALWDPIRGYHVSSTGADGAFTIEDVSGDVDVNFGVVAPLGFRPLDPVDGYCVIRVTGDMVQNVILEAIPTTGVARSMGYWKHQVSVYLWGKGTAQESEEDMRHTYPNALYSHFHENRLNAIQIEYVTFQVTGGPKGFEYAQMSLEEMDKTLSLERGKTMLDRAKQHYLALLLNVASGKVPTQAEVTVDHLTASQALQYVAALILDGDPTNDELAKDISETISEAQLVAAGVIPADFVSIAYARSPGKVEFYAAAGGQPGITSFHFSTLSTGRVTLMIYDVQGRRVRTLVDEVLNAGAHRADWDGRSSGGIFVGRGVYFARLQTPTRSLKLKVVELTR